MLSAPCHLPRKKNGETEKHIFSLFSSSIRIPWEGIPALIFFLLKRRLYMVATRSREWLRVIQFAIYQQAGKRRWQKRPLLYLNNEMIPKLFQSLTDTQTVEFEVFWSLKKKVKSFIVSPLTEEEGSQINGKTFGISILLIEQLVENCDRQGRVLYFCGSPPSREKVA